MQASFSLVLTSIEALVYAITFRSDWCVVFIFSNYYISVDKLLSYIHTSTASSCFELVLGYASQRFLPLTC